MNQHWIRKDERQEIIQRLKRDNDVTVKKTDKNNNFIVKGEGIFRCSSECGNSWSSHHTSVGIDLSRDRVFKRYEQRCQKCNGCWVAPCFTTDRFEKIAKRAIDVYHTRKNGNRGNRPPPVRGKTQGPHKMEDCEQCEELGRHC